MTDKELLKLQYDAICDVGRCCSIAEVKALLDEAATIIKAEIERL